FQLLLMEETQLLISDAAHALADDQPLYTFRLHSELDWEEADWSPSEGERSEWQRELRLVFDPAAPGVLRTPVGWSESPAFSNPALEIVSPSRPESALGREGPTRQRQRTRPDAR